VCITSCRTERRGRDEKGNADFGAGAEFGGSSEGTAEGIGDGAGRGDTERGGGAVREHDGCEVYGDGWDGGGGNLFIEAADISVGE